LTNAIGILIASPNELPSCNKPIIKDPNKLAGKSANTIPSFCVVSPLDVTHNTELSLIYPIDPGLEHACPNNWANINRKSVPTTAARKTYKFKPDRDRIDLIRRQWKKKKNKLVTKTVCMYFTLNLEGKRKLSRKNTTKLLNNGLVWYCDKFSTHKK